VPPPRTTARCSYRVGHQDLIDRVKAGQLVKELAPIVGGGAGRIRRSRRKDAWKIDELLGSRGTVTDALSS
jgi:hypothetical protein